MLYLLALAATSPPIFVATASSAPELAAGLAEELGKTAIAARAEDAELIVAIAEAGGSLELIVRIAGGAAIVQRSISLEDGRAPALRVAVLLVRAAVEAHAARRRERAKEDAVEDEPGQPKTSTAPPSLRAVERSAGAAGNRAVDTALTNAAGATRASDPAVTVAAPPDAIANGEDPLSLRVSPLFGVSAWSSPFLPPQLGFGLSAAITTRRFAFGATLLASGHLCCDRSSDAITADATELLLAADAAFTPIDLGPAKLGLHLAPGINVLRGRAAVREPIFADPGTPEDYATVQAIALAGVSASITLTDRFALLLRAGARATLSGRRPIAVPEPLAMGAKPLDSGAITPLLVAGLSVKIF